VLRPGAGVIY